MHAVHVTLFLGLAVPTALVPAARAPPRISSSSFRCAFMS